jgi:alkyl hydroperoxide reductase subunit AhpC
MNVAHWVPLEINCLLKEKETQGFSCAFKSSTVKAFHGLTKSISITVLFFPLDFFFVCGTGLELRAFTLSHSTSPFCDGYF